MDKKDMLFNRFTEFINEFRIDCTEDIYQRDSVNEECVDLVAELFEIVKAGEKNE